MDDLLVRSTTAYVAILRTKCRNMFVMNTRQFLIKPFDRLGCLEEEMSCACPDDASSGG